MFASKDLFFSKPSGYQISRSVRLRSSASAYLNRTFGTPTNNKIWTWSGWVKRGTLGASNYTLFGAYDGTSTYAAFLLYSADTIGFQYGGASANTGSTTAVYRDPSAWYHVVWSVNATAGTSVVYVNGVQTGSASIANVASQINSAISNTIGRVNATYYLDGYLTEVNFIDGQALTPSSFGETNAVTGVWQPKKYTGTYGTNGFYLNFSDNSGATATTIGKDYSGNGNNWTPNNISVTAGATYDSMLDVPTLYADGGNGRGNYATLNPVYKANSQPTISNANLTVAGNTTQYQNAFSSIGVTSGKWYVETLVVGTPNSANFIGISNAEQLNYLVTNGNVVGAPSGIGYSFVVLNGQKYTNGSASAYSSGLVSGDVLGMAFDADSGTLTFYKNGTSLGTAFTGINASTQFFFGATSYSTGLTSINFNFGQRPFSYTPPTGFVALNTQNLPTPTISNGANYMAATLWTGTGATASISNAVNGVSFQPDLVWAKSRSGAESNRLIDSVRGATKVVYSNLTNAETTEATGLTAFGSSGFTLGSGSPNTSAVTYVGWQWKAGTTSSSNTAGSITSTVSVGATQGFSVVTYTGTGVAATVGHGLGVKPSMIILKNRSGVYDWPTWSQYLPNPTTQHFWLNATNAAQTSSSFNSTQPTSSVFNIGTTSEANGNTNNFVAYCFAAVAGYSAFGSYTGNGSADGPFVFCGFRPRFILWKRTDAVSDWGVIDTARDTYNTTGYDLGPNSSAAEGTGYTVDFLSNGFKIRLTATRINASGGTYIFMAFAENPFKFSNAR